MRGGVVFMVDCYLWGVNDGFALGLVSWFSFSAILC